MYQKSIVTFIDILGFSQLVSECSAEEISNKLESLTKFVVPVPNDQPDALVWEPKAIQFSDSIVRIRPIEYQVGIPFRSGIFYGELYDLAHAQAALLNEGILIRGGVTIGDISIDKNNVFGPALVDAYKLESQIALYPRIVISPKLFSEVKINNLLISSHNTIGQELKEIECITSVGDDGYSYVDYCRVCQLEFDDPHVRVEYLFEHKKQIMRNISAAQSNISIRGKLMWLSQYHNACLSDLSDEELDYTGVDRPQLIITSKEFPALEATEL